MNKKTKNRWLTLLSAALALCALISLFASCGGKDEQGEDGNTYTGMPEYDIQGLDRYINAFSYVGLTVSAAEGESKQEALWSAIVESAEVREYPEEQVEYYAAQERAKYRYYAQRDGIDYDRLLDSLGVTEASIYDTAKKMVKDDLVFEYIVKDAGISLREEEKNAHLDKYAERFTEIYGYDKEYIKANMTEQVYDAMLFDKTMEYLFLNNTVEIPQG